MKSKFLNYILTLLASSAFVTAITTVNTVSRQSLCQPVLPASILKYKNH